MIEQLYKDTLAQMYQMLPMYQKVGEEAFKKGLGNIKELCWYMGLPQWKFPSVHIAGTNGKGSVSAMIASVLQEEGYKVGLYTSPHLVEFTERIKINGVEISKESVVEFYECYVRLIEEIKPSFFELTVAMAFEYFAEQEIDFAVIEVGLGGRLDSTNIIRPEVSVITNISFDHMKMLGDTLPLIAREKAGIIKPHTPVVIGHSHPETMPVFEEIAGQNEARLIEAEKKYHLFATERGFPYQKFQVQDLESGEEKGLKIDLAGHYQRENLRTALSTLSTLQEEGWVISDSAIQNGLRKIVQNTGLQGRMQQLSSSPPTICDTAHNEAGVKAVFQQLQHIPHQQLHIVWGMVEDKNHESILSLLPSDANYYFVRPEVPRGLNALTLQLKADVYQLKGSIYDSVSLGILAAIKDASPGDLVFIGGSTFVVSEALAHFGQNHIARS